MDVNERKLKALIRKGEGISTEFKTCRNSLSRDVYETVCAFLNRHGGTILLGVQDSGEPQGIAPGAIGQMKKDFVTAINNPQKLHPPAYLSVDEMMLEGKPILRIYVPESSQVHRCNGRIYDRNEDGDLDITDNTRQVADLYQRKQATYSENKIYPYAGLDELELELLVKCRIDSGVASREPSLAEYGRYGTAQKRAALSDRSGNRQERCNPCRLIAPRQTVAVAVSGPPPPH